MVQTKCLLGAIFNSLLIHVICFSMFIMHNCLGTRVLYHCHKSDMHIDKEKGQASNWVSNGHNYCNCLGVAKYICRVLLYTLGSIREYHYFAIHTDICGHVSFQYEYTYATIARSTWGNCVVRLSMQHYIGNVMTPLRCLRLVSHCIYVYRTAAVLLRNYVHDSFLGNSVSYPHPSWRKGKWRRHHRVV